MRTSMPLLVRASSGQESRDARAGGRVADAPLAAVSLRAFGRRFPQVAEHCDRKLIAQTVAVLLGILLWAAQPAWSQPIPYTFTRIADTIADERLAGPNCVGMNNLGTVIVTFSGELWRGGKAQTFSQVSDAVAGICASINDLDEIAYVTYSPPNTLPNFLVRNANGSLTTLARSDTFPALHAGRTYLPSLAANGSAVFQGNGNACGNPPAIDGNGIYVGPSGPTVFDPLCNPSTFVGSTSVGTMNDSLVVAFLAIRPDASAPAGSRVGIYRGSLTPLVEDGNATVGAVGLHIPVINNSGTVAFVGVPDGTASIFTTNDGVNFTRVGAPVDGVGGYSMNNSGQVAYRGAAGSGSGIFTGPDLINDKVIAPGDSLDASTFVGGFIWEEGLSDSGQIAFWAELADGRRGVYLADPCAANISASVSVTRSMAKLNRKTGRYEQKVTLKNTSTTPFSGPISLALDGLTNVTLLNLGGVTECTEPTGSPYVEVDTGSDGIFTARERAIVNLEFSAEPSTNSVRVLAGSNR